MPDLSTEEGLAGLATMCRIWKAALPDLKLVIERVGGYVGEAQPGSTMFTFGWNACAPRVAAIASGISLHSDPTPMQWQKHFTLPKRGRTPKGKQQHKRDLKDAAQVLFPRVRVTLWNADALLLYYLAHKELI